MALIFITAYIFVTLVTGIFWWNAVFEFIELRQISDGWFISLLFALLSTVAFLFLILTTFKYYKGV